MQFSFYKIQYKNNYWQTVIVNTRRVRSYTGHDYHVTILDNVDLGPVGSCWCQVHNDILQRTVESWTMSPTPGAWVDCGHLPLLTGAQTEEWPGHTTPEIYRVYIKVYCCLCTECPKKN